MSTHRTSSSLIAVLEAESANFDAVCMVIAFADYSQFVLADDPERLAKLERALDEGGEAIGLIAMKHDRNTLTIGSRLFREYKNDQSARECLEKLADACGEMLTQRRDSVN